MRIHGWRIDGFGIFSGETVTDLPPGLTIVAGPNEAGKSTLLAFIRGVLFGFPDGRSRSRRHEPVRGGRHGGAVLLADEDGEVWTVERHVEPRSFSLRRPDGSPAADHELLDLLGHADATLFANVFAFGLSELDGFELLDSDAVRDRVFSAGVVGAGRSARQALDVIDARRAELVRPRARCVVGTLADEVRESRRVLSQARAAAADLARRRDDVDRLAELGDARRRDVEQCREEQQRLRLLLELWPVRNRLDDIEDELADLSVPGSVDATTEGRYERTRAELDSAMLALEEAERDLTVATERRDATTVDPELDEIGPLIRAHAADLAVELARSTRLTELERALVDQREQLDEALARLGSEWDRDHLAAFDISIPAADEVRARGQQLEQLESRLAELGAERVAVERAHAEAMSALADLEGRLGEPDSAPTSGDIERQRSALRQLRTNLVELRSESARQEAAERSIEGLRAALPTRPPASGSSSIGTGLLSVGAVLVVLGVAAAVGGATEPGLALVGVGAAAIVLGAAVVLTRRSATRPDDTSHLIAQIAEAERTRDAAAARVEILRTSVRAASMVLGLAPDPSPLDVEDRAAELDRAVDELRTTDEGRRRVDVLLAERDAAAARRAELDVELGELEPSVDAARAEWEEWKAAHRVPPALGVQGINDLFTAIERARGLLRSLQAAEREWSQLDEASTAWRSRAAELLDQAGAGVGDDVVADLRALAERAEADVAARRALEEREVAVEEAEQRAEVVFDRVAVARAELDAIHADAGVDDEAAFRAVLERWRRRRELVVEEEQATQRIRAAVGRGEAAEALLEGLDAADPSGWQAQLDDAVARLAGLEAQHEDAIRIHQDAARHLEELSRSADVAEASLRAETLRTQLADAVAEWQMLSAARELVADTLGRYERERQPAVLSRAERMFAAATDGHYTELSVSAGATTLVDRKGRRLTTDDLSRGTAEQLYLCLRFGLAEEMAAHTPLPFVMDDVLVNFDPERMAHMAALIGELAGNHQILAFTCQPSTVAALREVRADARLIELPRHGVRS